MIRTALTAKTAICHIFDPRTNLLRGITHIKMTAHHSGVCKQIVCALRVSSSKVRNTNKPVIV